MRDLRSLTRKPSFIFCRRAMRWNIERDWIVNTAGGRPAAFYLAVQAFSNPGEGLIMMRGPSTTPFFFAAGQFDRHACQLPSHRSATVATK